MLHTSIRILIKYQCVRDLLLRVISPQSIVMTDIENKIQEYNISILTNFLLQCFAITLENLKL